MTRPKKVSQRQIEEVQERHRRNWNAMVKREETAERKAPAKQKPPKLRRVK